MRPYFTLKELTPKPVPAIHPAKIALYHRGCWYAPAPPVCTMAWDSGAWCRWIETHGRWLPDFEGLEI